MIDFNLTLTIGNIIEIATIAVGGIATLITLRVTVGNIKTDMVDMKAEIKKVGEVLITLAVTQTRLDNAENAILELRHGRGFIKDRSQGGINGEWP